MKYISIPKVLSLLLITFACISCSGPQKPEATNSKDDRPNIIFILADDLGFSDLGCYGGEINTPNLDRLANNGLRFTQFYNTSRCCPTRASLLTGLYSHQAGIGRMTMDTGKPGYRGFLTDNTVTIAEVLRNAGYQTGMTGKWHVSETKRLDKEDQLKWLSHQEDFGPFSDTTTYPTARGFDKFYGNIWGVVDYFDPFSLVNGKEEVEKVPDGFYYTNAITDSTVAYVEEFSSKDKPFFLFMAYTAPHWPLQALPEDIAKYEGTYKVGWNTIRNSRYERMIDMGLMENESTTLTPWMFPEMIWETNEHITWDSRAMAVHAAMVDRMDQGIGKLIAKLKETGELENTLILFLSDNGASYERPSKYGPGFDRPGNTRDGREVFFPVDKEIDHLPGPETVDSGIGPQWAHSSNAPFKYWKSKVYEGGICTPMIVHWPAGIKDVNGINRSPGHVIDLMATCIDLANAEYPKTYEGRTITPTQGKSLIPVLKNGTREPHEYLFWEHFGSRAIRKGDWKLVKLKPEDEWELYNLATDRTEGKNVASEHPELVLELSKKWEQMADSLNVYPAP